MAQPADLLVERRSPVVAVGEKFFCQRARQHRVASARQPDGRHQLGNAGPKLGRKPRLARATWVSSSVRGTRKAASTSGTSRIALGVPAPAQVQAGRQRQGAALGVEQRERRLEDGGDAPLAHVGHGGHHTGTPSASDSAATLMNALLAGLAEAVEGDNQRLAEFAEFLGEARLDSRAVASTTWISRSGVLKPASPRQAG